MKQDEIHDNTEMTIQNAIYQVENYGYSEIIIKLSPFMKVKLK